MVVGVEVRRPDAGLDDSLDLRAPLGADRIDLIALEFPNQAWDQRNVPSLWARRGNAGSALSARSLR